MTPSACEAPGVTHRTSTLTLNNLPRQALPPPQKGGEMELWRRQLAGFWPEILPGKSRHGPWEAPRYPKKRQTSWAFRARLWCQ